MTEIINEVTPILTPRKLGKFKVYITNNKFNDARLLIEMQLRNQTLNSPIYNILNGVYDKLIHRMEVLYDEASVN
jgi:hypothetical protein